MNKCATCKWWQSQDRYSHSLCRELGEARELYLPDGRTEDGPPAEYPVRLCTSPRLLFYETPPRDGAALADGSMYRADLATGPDFGCSLWETARDDATGTA